MTVVPYIFATAAPKPCVVNLRLRTSLGPHDGTMPLEEMLDSQVVQNVNGQRLGVPRRAIVVAAGHHANDGVHADALVGGDEGFERPQIKPPRVYPSTARSAHPVGWNRCGVGCSTNA